MSERWTVSKINDIATEIKKEITSLLIELEERDSTIKMYQTENKRLRDGLVAFREYFKSCHENGYDEDDIRALMAVRDVLGGSAVVVERRM